MADMDVDVPAEPAQVRTKSKAREDGKDGKKRFEVKKARTLGSSPWLHADHDFIDFSGTQ